MEIRELMHDLAYLGLGLVLGLIIAMVIREVRISWRAWRLQRR